MGDDHLIRPDNDVFDFDHWRTYNELEHAFGCTVHGWPAIQPFAPKWWQRKAVKREAKVNAALATIGKGPLTDAMRLAYWRQVRIGQDVYEDAGGYCWRCWLAALDLPFRAPSISYRDLLYR